MQYTDNEAALIGGLISTYFLRPAVSAALKDSYTRVLEHLRTGRLSAGDLQQIQKALTFLTPTCRASISRQRRCFVPATNAAFYFHNQSYRLRGILRRRLPFAYLLHR